MALFELKQDTGSGAAAPWAPPTFKDCVAADIDAAFFEENEHADRHTVDGKDVLIVLEDDDLREHSAHWEAGAKQNFDTGLYTAHTILYIRVEDYGPKPKIGKQLVLDKGTKSQRTYTINLCQEESGVYRMYHLAVELEKKYYRKTTAQELDVELEWLRNLVRMAADKDLCGAKFAPPLSMHQYETWARYNTEIGCLLGKYIASVKK